VIVRFHAGSKQTSAEPLYLSEVEEPARHASNKAIATRRVRDPERLERNSHRGKAITRGELHDGLQNDGMQMKVPVAVDVVHDQPGPGEPLELGGDLGARLAAQFGREEERHPEAHGIL
jgi:hypothetical protein